MRGGVNENEEAAIQGGTVAGNAREELEKKSGRKVVTSGNFTSLTEKKKRQIDKS
jgi:DNA-damage-inducible protein D